MTNNRLEEIRAARQVGVLPWSHLSSPTASFGAACETVDYLLSLLDARPAVAADARELVQEFFPPDANPEAEWTTRLIERITTYANQQSKQAWREGVEAAAMVADDCNYHKDDCKQCLQATTIAMLIRALINRPNEKS